MKSSPPTLETIGPDGKDKVIKCTKFTKLLGGILQEDLTWRGHIDLGDKSLLPTLRKKLGGLKIISRQISKEGRRCLANGLLISKLIYLIPIWGGANQNHIRKLQTFVNCAARFVLKTGKKTKIRKLMEQCKWLYVSEMIDYHSLIMLWKIVNFNKPANMKTLFKLDENNLICTEKEPRLLINSTNFKFRTKEKWNLMSSDLRQEKSLPRFKAKLKPWIISLRPPEVTQ